MTETPAPFILASPNAPGGSAEGKTILEALADGNVVSFNLSDDGRTVIAREECDTFFYAEMSRSDVETLAGELKGLAARMAP